MTQPAQQQNPPGRQAAMEPRPDCGEDSYRGHGRLKGKVAVVTGADSGIGRAVAIAYAREGADVLISYLSEHEDAADTARHVEEAGRRVCLLAGDLASPDHCRAVVARAVEEFGRIDVLVNNAAYQMSRESLEDIPDEEWDHTIATNLSAMFHLCKAALPHMKTGAPSSIARRSTLTTRIPLWHRTPPPRPPSPTSARALPSSLASAASGSTAWPQARSGHRSSLPRWSRTRSRSSAPTRLWADPGSRSSSHRSTCCSPPTRPAICRERASPSRAVVRSSKRPSPVQ